VKRYPVEERGGVVYVFNGAQPLFPLPFFEGESRDDFVAARPIRLLAQCDWRMSSANAFDVYHFEQFHGRKLEGPPGITQPHEHAYRVQHRFEIKRPSPADRLLILLGGKRGEFDYTSWRGGFVLLRVRFRSLENHMEIGFWPEGEGKCGISITVLKRTGFGIPLGIKRKMTDLFFRGEAGSLKGVVFRPQTLVERDEPLKRYMEWLTLTGPGPEATIDRGGAKEWPRPSGSLSSGAQQSTTF
jgi:hypothetical protein